MNQKAEPSGGALGWFDYRYNPPRPLDPQEEWHSPFDNCIYPDPDPTSAYQDDWSRLLRLAYKADVRAIRRCGQWGNGSIHPQEWLMAQAEDLTSYLLRRLTNCIKEEELTNDMG